jgi:monofunctional glycosyltransferase
MTRSRRPRRTVGLVFRWTAILGAAVVVVTCAQVLALRWLEPGSTAWMKMRARQARQEDRVLEIRHTWVDLGDIPRDLRRAVVLAEDGNFYTHHGFDWEAIRAARARNERADRVKFGGSTITQQLAKNLFLSPERTWLRKGREAFITATMELLLPKDRILELYLNAIEFGPGVFGVAEGARYHFGTTVAQLSRDQSCRLAAIIPAPLRYRAGGSYVARRAGQLAKMLD